MTLSSKARQLVEKLLQKDGCASQCAQDQDATKIQQFKIYGPEFTWEKHEKT